VRAFVRAFDAHVTLLNVVSLQRSIVPGTVREAEAYMTATRAGLEEQGIAAEAIVRRGDPAPVIIAVVDEVDADLILMTSRGRGSLGRLVLGSVTDAVLAGCQKPVLLFSESAPAQAVSEVTRRQSAYLATVIWNKQATGIYTGADAKRELEHLSALGLDREILFSTYQALEQEGGIPFLWLDIAFQMETLRSYLPHEIESAVEPQVPSLPDALAA
jgi:hypothetical protein